MTPPEWAAVAAAIMSVFGMGFAALRWTVKSFLHELVPNSGSSMHDKVTRLECRVDEIYKIVAEGR